MEQVKTEQQSPERLYRVSTIATCLDTSRSEVYKLLKDGQLRYVRLGRAIRVPDDALRAFLSSLR